MEKEENVKEGVSEQPEEKKSAAYYEKRPEFGNRGPSKILLHFRKGLTFFLVIAACVIFYFALLRINDISAGISKLVDVLKPILYGFAIAYLLNPVVKQIDRWLIPQASTNARTFILNQTSESIELTKVLSPEKVAENRGEKGTFFLNVQYRQNSSWQGIVNWIEGNITYHFLSVLELLKILSNVLV